MAWWLVCSSFEWTWKSPSWSLNNVVLLTFRWKKSVTFPLIPLMWYKIVLHQTSYKVFWQHTTYLQNKVHSRVEYCEDKAREIFNNTILVFAISFDVTSFTSFKEHLQLIRVLNVPRFGFHFFLSINVEMFKTIPVQTRCYKVWNSKNIKAFKSGSYTSQKKMWMASYCKAAFTLIYILLFLYPCLFLLIK